LTRLLTVQPDYKPVGLI